MGLENLTHDDQKFIIEKAALGYDAEEIGYVFRNDYGKPIQTETVDEYLNSDGAQEQIALLKRVREKKAEITKEDLLNELVDLKTDIQDWREQLKDDGHGKTNNEAITNIITIIDKIGELIGELDKRTTQKADNIVNINNVQKNITHVVQHLPQEKKKDIVEQLKDDDDVEDFIIRRKSEA